MGIHTKNSISIASTNPSDINIPTTNPTIVLRILLIFKKSIID